ncbi:GlxA family transcriptional regulator [Dyella humi]|uniref:GlxA family transcriptional regulator n=1 Tax=Dyella humi TaxID=1770547 RepID=A0ABW8IK71_9GAMM
MAKKISILALPGVQLLDVSGPLDVFAQANIETGSTFYELEIVACKRGPLTSSSGVRLLPDRVAGESDDRVDTLLVAGAPHAAEYSLSAPALAWLRRTSVRARRYGSVCTGAFVLAATGLLKGKRITTHWAAADRFRSAYPSVTVNDDALYVRDGKLRTAAGVTAGLDLSLSLVEEDLGRDVAMEVASQLVMFFKRPGGQMQFSRKGETRPAGRSVLQEVQRWVVAHPALDHGVSELAERAGLSPRHFARLFHAEVGVTPAAWVEAARVDAARALFEAGYSAPKQVAAKCGFHSVDTFRRVFAKHVGVTPAEYRKRYMPVAEHQIAGA